MATSGTYTFNLDVLKCLEAAYRRAGIDFRTGYEARAATECMNLLLTSWMNKGVNLWKIDQKTKALVASTSTYTLDTEVVDVLDAVVRDSNSDDRVLTRISLQDYLDYPNKDATGTPVVFTAERNVASVSITVWPVPTEAMTFVYYAIIMPEDVSGYEQTVDLPRRFLDAFIWGLALYLAADSPGKVTPEHRVWLNEQYTAAFEDAKMEDRERGSFWVRPKLR